MVATDDHDHGAPRNNSETYMWITFAMHSTDTPGRSRPGQAEKDNAFGILLNATHATVCQGPGIKKISRAAFTGDEVKKQSESSLPLEVEEWATSELNTC